MHKWIILLSTSTVSCSEACVVPVSHIKSLLLFCLVSNFASHLPPLDVHECVCLLESVCLFTPSDPYHASGHNVLKQQQI